MRRDMLRVKAPKKMAIGGSLVLMRSANVRARIPIVKYAFVAMTISPEKLRFNPHLSSGPAARFTRKSCCSAERDFQQNSQCPVLCTGMNGI